MWRSDEVTVDTWKTAPHRGGFLVTGNAKAKSKDGKRAYDLAVRVSVTRKNGAIKGFDLVARGTYRGGGRFTSNDLPKGAFRFAVATALAPDTEAAKVPPQGSRDLRGYLRAK